MGANFYRFLQQQLPKNGITLYIACSGAENNLTKTTLNGFLSLSSGWFTDLSKSFIILLFPLSTCLPFYQTDVLNAIRSDKPSINKPAVTNTAVTLQRKATPERA